MSVKPDAPATYRNRDAILAVLRDELGGSGSVLEIGSGTGQHAMYFGCQMPEVEWQTSDRIENHDGISAWIEQDALSNVLRPLDLDVEETVEVPGSYDAIFSANTAHIMNYHAVECMISLVGRSLDSGGVFCLYGPFKLMGDFTSESNVEFDRSLKARDPKMGVRDFEDIDRLASESGLSLLRRYAMPANNMLVVWKKQGT